MITRTLTTTIELTPQELAFCFCNMDSEGQAEFFNEVAILVENWRKPFPFQLEMLSRSEHLTADGRRIMEVIGDYSHHNE